MATGLNILALVTDAHGGYGGIAQYNRDLFRALADSAAVSRVLALPRLGGDIRRRASAKTGAGAARSARASPIRSARSPQRVREVRST